jgi:hypothetical protein
MYFSYYLLSCGTAICSFLFYTVLNCRAPGGKTKLIHSETFKGILVGMALDAPNIEKGFSAMNVALKQRVEAA